MHDNRFEPRGLVHLGEDAAASLRGVIVERQDVLINITGDSILRCCVVPDEALPARVNQHVAILRASDEMHPLILQKQMVLPVMKSLMLGHSAGGTRKAITKGHLENFLVVVPPVGVQQRLAVFLQALDDKIESNRRAINISTALLDATSSSFALALPSVPLAAVAEPVRETFDPISLGTDLIDHFSIPAFDAKGLPDRTTGASVISSKLRVGRPSVLVSRLNPKTNRTWFAVPEPGVTAGCSTEFLVLKPTAGVTLGSLWLAVRDEGFRSLLAQRVTGTSGSHQRVTPLDAVATEVPDVRQMPAADVEAADELLRLVHQRRVESTRLAALRDALLPELLSGRIRLPAVSQTVEAALA